MTITNPRTTNNHRSTALLTLVASCLMLLVGSTRSAAENPWMSSSLGWGSSSSFGVSSRGWSSWENTHGGTFGGHSSSSFEAPHDHHESFERAPLEATRDTDIDPALVRAGSIAEQRARPHSTMLCWRYVKEALVASGSVSSYPQSAYAKQAGEELVHSFGFVRLPVRSPERAPVGSVLVYGGPGAGHVEIRTARGFVSDFRSSRPVNMPFIGAYTRMEKHHGQTAQIALADNSHS
ncbi:hypothetical protein CfE428DRAFT_1046 [Chthoniobacter flavus Ellin428]|uniref:Peptidase C51 domain-containing protein n=1 Tax=Chthoniobacter flavus Ellin428 TaxID=497964 RepID=B4CWK8_9BACT|nr:hypothetical protein [Chthoniobacter flavus]EDY21800.1 hypothetical protein CfE428DRAFT_1046 [Chthoniobacter flavus Ellin428]TCO95729.1 hypothetical protein EV701_101420 [Chthoniobacter flavus]